MYYAIISHVIFVGLTVWYGQDGETALMMACRNGRLSCMELLFNRHASDTIDTNVRTQYLCGNL